MNKFLSTIPLNVNRLNAPIKRHRVAEWIRKQDLYICCLQQQLFFNGYTLNNVWDDENTSEMDGGDGCTIM